MNAFLDLISSFPTAIWTVPLGVSLCLGLLTLLGALDLDTFDLDPDVGVEADVDLDLDVDGELPAHGNGILHGLTDALALGTVPLTIVVTAISIIGWLASVTAEVTLAGPARDVVGPWIYGAGMLVITFLLAVWLTTYVVKPLKPVFITHTQREGHSLLGHVAVVRSGRVDAAFGTAVTQAADGTSINLNVICDQPNALTSGDEVTIVAYDDERKRYAVAPLDPAKRLPEGAVSASPGAAERLPTDLADGRSDRPTASPGEHA